MGKSPRLHFCNKRGKEIYHFWSIYEYEEELFNDEKKKMPFHSGKQFHSPLPAYRKGQKTKYACYLENRVNWHKNEVCQSTLQDEWGQSRQSVLSKSFGVRKIHWISMTTCLWVKSTESQRKGSFATKPLHELEI